MDTNCTKIISPQTVPNWLQQLRTSQGQHKFTPHLNTLNQQRCQAVGTVQCQHKFNPHLNTLNQKSNVKLSILFNSSDPVGNLISLSLLYPRMTYDLHVGIAMGLHQSFAHSVQIKAILRETWLVCRLYTQAWRTICMSVSLWACIRVSLILESVELFNYSFNSSYPQGTRCN